MSDEHTIDETEHPPEAGGASQRIGRAEVGDEAASPGLAASGSEETAARDEDSARRVGGFFDETASVREAGTSRPRGAPRRIGRYLVIERLGEGAMGVVYAAFDPELSRKLAIKLLHGHADGELTQQRLTREAQALARLSHPNVVQIYDVGTHDGAVYVAMELAEGETMRQWLATKRPWREVLAVLLQAGRGLAAAHRTGIVHRDVKPDNVLVGGGTSGGSTSGDSISGGNPSGRGEARGSITVRVVDFGLARAAMELDPGEAIRSTPSLASASASQLDEIASDSLGERMTRTGARLGTPAYMAPEQWHGTAVDARTDQFAFCVLAWEALWGERPFRGANLTTLGFAITQGDVTMPANPGAVPSWIQRLLLQGLRADPAQRHADMDTLLAALARDPAAARRRWLAVGLALAAIGGSVAFGATLAAENDTDPCAAHDDVLAGTWDPSRRAAIATALRSTGRSYAEDTVANLDARIDGWAQRFVAARRDACEDTRVRGEQSAEAMDLRIACLDRGRRALAALVDVLAAADTEVLDRAVKAADELPDPASCDDLERLRDAALYPEDVEQRAEVDALRERLAQVHALAGAARYDAATATLDETQPRVDALGWAPLVAEWRELEGVVALGRGDAAAAETSLRAAMLKAIEGRHDRLAWASASRLAMAQAVLPGRAEEARRSIELARAQLLHAGLGVHEQASLESAAFRVEAAAGDYAAARAHIERSIALRESLGADDADLASAYANLGAILGVSGEPGLATEQLEQAIAMRERVQAPGHPDVGRDLHNLGSMYAQQRAYDRAAPILERALAIKREVLGPSHPDVAYTLISLGNVAVARRRFDEAETSLRAALAIQEATLGADHPDLAFALLGLGDRFLQDGRAREALPLLRRALAIREAAQGPDHPEVAPVALALGVAELDGGDARAALVQLERAHAGMSGSADPTERADAAWALARAQRVNGREREAIAMARTARADYVAAGPEQATKVTMIDAWSVER